MKTQLNKFWVVLAIFFVAIFGQIIYSQNNQIKLLKEIVQLNEKALKIDQDQIRDLIYLSQEEKNKSEEVATRNYVAGIVDCINRRDYYTEVWHEGFDRGMENKLIIEEAEKAALIAAQIKDKK